MEGVEGVICVSTHPPTLPNCIPSDVHHPMPHLLHPTQSMPHPAAPPTPPYTPTRGREAVVDSGALHVVALLQVGGGRGQERGREGRRGGEQHG